MPATGNLTRIRFETTAGPVVSEVQGTREKVDWCRFENVPAFVAERDVPIELPGYGALKADISFGGQRALLPTIKGKANLTGYAKWVFDADDPVSAGFLIS